MSIMEPIEALLKLDNPLARFHAASHQIDEHRVMMSRLRTVRAQALLELRGTRSAAELAGELGVSRQQIHRLLREAIGSSYDAV